VQGEDDIATKGLEFGGMGAGQPVQKRYLPQKGRFYICTRCHTGDYQLKVPAEEAWKQHGHSN
jgi:hypothetical protein